jgi:hypothetical protein
MSRLSDAAWIDYEQDGDKNALATKQSLFFRSVFMPTLGSALDGVRQGDAKALRVFPDRLEAGPQAPSGKPAGRDAFPGADHRPCETKGRMMAVRMGPRPWIATR